MTCQCSLVKRFGLIGTAIRIHLGGSLSHSLRTMASSHAKKGLTKAERVDVTDAIEREILKYRLCDHNDESVVYPSDHILSFKVGGPIIPKSLSMDDIKSIQSRLGSVTAMVYSSVCKTRAVYLDDPGIIKGYGPFATPENVVKAKKCISCDELSLSCKIDRDGDALCPSCWRETYQDENDESGEPRCERCGAFDHGWSYNKDGDLLCGSCYLDDKQKATKKKKKAVVVEDAGDDDDDVEAEKKTDAYDDSITNDSDDYDDSITELDRQTELYEKQEANEWYDNYATTYYSEEERDNPFGFHSYNMKELTDVINILKKLRPKVHDWEHRIIFFGFAHDIPRVFNSKELKYVCEQLNITLRITPKNRASITNGNISSNIYELTWLPPPRLGESAKKSTKARNQGCCTVYVVIILVVLKTRWTLLWVWC
jgi:uncharacterized Zn finger protein (UPF0148 family)